MTRPRRPRPRPDVDRIGVVISRSSNFSIGGKPPDGDDCANPPKLQRLAPYRVRTHTGRVLEGCFVVPGEPRGDLILGVALVRIGDENSLFTATLNGNTVLFEPADFEAVNGAHATVSYLTAG